MKKRHVENWLKVPVRHHFDLADVMATGADGG